MADWVVVADSLFSIELLDRRVAGGSEAVLLDSSPEFEPYPEGRVVVTTEYLSEVETFGDAVASALSSSGAWSEVLASISARLLLSLANPTIPVVHGLAGVALSRTWVGVNRPRVHLSCRLTVTKTCSCSRSSDTDETWRTYSPST